MPTRNDQKQKGGEEARVKRCTHGWILRHIDGGTVCTGQPAFLETLGGRGLQKIGTARSLGQNFRSGQARRNFFFHRNVLIFATLATHPQLN
jgi:hypothetical protein